MQYLTLWDAILTPIYLIILTAIAKRHRDKNYPKGHPLHKYFLKGLYLKFAGAIFIALIYQFLYGGGDTFNFYQDARIINSSLDHSFFTWLKIMMRVPPENAPEIYSYVSNLHWYYDPSSYTIAAIAAFLGLISGTTYIPIALLFAVLSYTGVWAMFRTFVGIYPRHIKSLAIAFLYIPSTIVWGSAIFKDTICMFALGWMIYTTFRIFINRDFSLKNLFLLSLSFYLIAIVKIYILLAFIPALGLWISMNYSKKIKLAAARWLLNIFFVFVTIVGFLFFSQKFAEDLNRYSLDKLVETANVTRGYIAYVSEDQGGSAYDLGEFDPTIQGMLSKFPSAVAVTLYRPFLWETRKPIMVLSALESFAFIVLTLMILFKIGPVKMVKNTLKDPNLLFFVVFSLIFAFAVGISTYNFGSLSRYKIPCMPFFAAFLMIQLNNAKKPKNNFVKTSTSTSLAGATT